MLKSSRSQLIDLHWFLFVYHWSGMDKVIQENQDLCYNNSCFLCFQCKVVWCFWLKAVVGVNFVVNNIVKTKCKQQKRYGS